MQKVILHISDLHVSCHVDDDGNALKKPVSWLDTNTGNVTAKNFIDEFCSHVLAHYHQEEKYLLISGDLTDKGDESEYQSLRFFLDRIINKLQIPAERLLIIPGDHDVNRFQLDTAFRAAGRIGHPYAMAAEKFKNFSTFYNDQFERTFPTDRVVTDTLVFPDEQLLIVGLNSNGHIGLTGGLGFMDHDQLDAELTSVLAAYPDYVKLAVFHHNFYGIYENSVDGQWEASNRISVKGIIENHKFAAMLYGNEHTSGSNSFNQLVQIAAPALSKSGVACGFKAYRIVNDTEGLSLSHMMHGLRTENAHTDYPFGSWSIQEKNNRNENLDQIVLRKPVPVETVIETQDIFALSAQENTALSASPEAESTQTPRLYFTKNEYHQKLFHIVKELSLFKSGHFHWSDSSKAHNWIDVPMLLSERDHVLLAQKAIFDVVSKNSIPFDFVLALGIEGNIIASYTALRSGKPFSFLPYSYRYNDHENYEKHISTKNGGRYRNILIITDVVNNGKTVDRLVENETEFFKPDFIESISVVSLFYTGATPENIFSTATTLKVDHYFVSHIKVERCPYQEDFRETCMIYREKLACVHEFYDATLPKS